MATLIAIPLFGFLTVLQSAILSRLPLLQGTVDIILLVLIAWALQEPVRTAWQWAFIGGILFGYASILPIYVPILTYAVITGVVILIRRRIWENPILAMFMMTFIGSILSQVVYATTVYLTNFTNELFRLPIFETFKLIILPSLLLNIILAAPVYAVIRDLAEWIYPEEIKV
jgi:rod shape-determining protein MreD